MYHLSNQVASVNRLLCVIQDNFYCQTVKENIFSIFSKYSIFEVDENFESGYYYNQAIYLRAISGKSYSITNNSMEKIEYDLFTSKSFNSKYVDANKNLDYDLKNQKWVGIAGVYDLEQKKLIETEIALGMRAFINNFVFFCPNDKLIRFDPPTGEVLWSFSFAGFGKIINEYRKEAEVTILFFLGVVGNQLWILLNSRQYLVIDVETGKQLTLIGDAYDGKQYTNRQFGLGQIDDKNKKVILLSNHQYAEIDCNSFEIKDVDLFEEFEKHSVSSGGRFQIDEDYIYFYDKKFIGLNQCCKVAVLDRKTLKVVWSYDFAQHGTAPMQMEKTENHLFVLDSGGTLHIFEREE
jgi:outer membrane protein assembly factor BamB